MATTKVIISVPSWINTKKSKSSSCDDLGGLCDAVAKIARAELREDKSTREQSLVQFKDWIKKNIDIQNCRTDDQFLLRFLRAKKFSVPMAEQMLLKYLNLRRTFSHFMNNLDFLSSPVNELISNGYIFPSPIRDKHGRRVIFTLPGRFDPYKFTSSDMAKAHFITYETLLDSPENQVLGVTHIGDMQGISTAHITCWSPSEFARVIKWGEQSMPMRHKEIHMINLPSTVKFALDFTLTRVTNKIKERFMLHSTLNDLHKKLDKSVFPAEMGGTIPMAEMVSLWKTELAAKREKIMALDQIILLSDRQILNKRNDDNNNQEFGASLAGSFRKLEVD